MNDSRFMQSTSAIAVAFVLVFATTGQYAFGVDTTPPVISMPPPMTAEATSPSGAVLSFTATAIDDDDPSPTVVCPASGSVFPLGTTIATCTATDASGNSASGTVALTVKDTNSPAIAMPPPITAEATSPSGAAVSFTATAADIADPSPTVFCPTSGFIFPLGTTPATCIATDASANIASGNVAITVVDTTAPFIIAPTDVTAEATGPLTPVSLGSPSVSDAVDPSLAITNDASGLFTLGTTLVTWTATDFSGNHASATQSVTVKDTTSPTIIMPAPMTAEATSPSGAAVSFTASAADMADPSPTVSCPASGSTFPLGTTTATCTATDASGNFASGNVAIMVVDTTKPTISVPAPITAEATSPSGAAVSFTATAADIADPSPTVVCPTSGSIFPLGTTFATCIATDASANIATGTVAITVEDTTAPVIASHSDVIVGATGVLTAVSYTNPTATDAVDGTDPVTCLPASGTAFTIGSHTITCTAQDSHGNIATPTTFNVIVNSPIFGTGFRQPIDNPGTFNVANKDKTIPVKFNIYRAGGTEITDPTIVKNFRLVKLTSCGTGATDTVEEYASTTTGQTVARYEGGMMIYNLSLKTSGTGGSPVPVGCYKVSLVLNDGSPAGFVSSLFFNLRVV